MGITLALPLTLALTAQAPPDADAIPGTPPTRLAFMKKTVAGFEVRSADDPAKVYTLQAEPVMRFTNTVGESRDGAIFLWLDDRGRPEVALQIAVLRGGGWFHEFTSLSTGRVTARVPGLPDWSPSRGGAEFKPVPGAPRPADTPEQRLVQMRALTREFAAEDEFRGGSWQPLRLLTKPFARYGKPGTDVTDGALFSYVLTTDPEVLLMLEARPGKDGPAWHYAFAPMTVYGVRGSFKGGQVWELGNRWGNNGPADTFQTRGLPAAGSPGEPSPR
jgi:hypothetical protein